MRDVLISDFGGVLTTPMLAGFLAYGEESGITVEQIGLAMARATDEHGDNPLFQLERGEISETEFAARLTAQLGDSFDLTRLAALCFERLEPNRAMVDYVRELRGRGVRAALLTNNVREWEARWRSKLPELDELFELVVDSAFVGMRKPERAIFELTLERMGGVEPERCVFVDDLDVNCAAARELGMAAVRFESAEQAIPEIETAFGRS